jgi:hypothetical protein
VEQRVILPKEDEVRREVRVKRFLIFLLGLDAKRPWELVVRPFVRSRSLQQNRTRRTAMVKPKYRWVEAIRAWCLTDWRQLRPGIEQVIGRKK